MKTSASWEKLKTQLLVLKDNPKALMTMAVMMLLLDGAVLLRGQFYGVTRMFVKADQLKTDIQNARTESHFIATYKNRQNDLKNEIARLNKMMILEGELPAVMESISKYAELSVVRILKIKPLLGIEQEQKALTKAAALPVENFRRQKISITAKSGFHQLGRFVALLENSGVFLDIKTIEIRSDEQEYMRQIVTILLEVLVRKA